jgi:hypothetical protein
MVAADAWYDIFSDHQNQWSLHYTYYICITCVPQIILIYTKSNYIYYVGLQILQSLWIHHPAVLADLSAWASKWTYIPHLDHGICKVCLEKIRISAITLDQAFGCRSGLITGEQNLVGTKKALWIEQVLKVVVVECINWVSVQGYCIVSITVRGARSLQIGHHACFHCTVWRRQPIAEGDTPCLSNCMTSYTILIRHPKKLVRSSW